jgi:prepilin-type N-terminal cleavage/methylation domain-containing protein
MLKKNNLGFTIFELVIVIAILSIISSIVVSDFIAYKKNSDLNNNTQEFISALKSAQNKTISSDDYKTFGVYLNTSVSPNQYVLFKGVDYTVRETIFDQVYSLDSSMEFYNVNFGGGNEIVFSKVSGEAEKFGSASIRFKNDTNKNKTIYVTNFGVVSLSQPAEDFGEDRITDARHVQFNYTRVIDLLTENLTLTFDGNQSYNIPMSSNLNDGEFYWDDIINISGADQKWEIKTIGINSSNVLFDIYRDAGNNKGLTITISGDSSGYLAQYPANGSTANFLSIYVTDFYLR